MKFSEGYLLYIVFWEGKREERESEAEDGEEESGNRGWRRRIKEEGLDCFVTVCVCVCVCVCVYREPDGKHSLITKSDAKQVR